MYFCASPWICWPCSATSTYQLSNIHQCSRILYVDKMLCGYNLSSVSHPGVLARHDMASGSCNMPGIVPRSADKVNKLGAFFRGMRMAWLSHTYSHFWTCGQAVTCVSQSSRTLHYLAVSFYSPIFSLHFLFRQQSEVLGWVLINRV